MTYRCVICARRSGWQSCPVTDRPADPVDPADASADPDLEALVGSWLPVPDVAERLGVPLSQVRRMLEERELLGHRIGARRILAVPEQFLDERVLRHLRGTFTVLADGGMDDEEILRWLFTPDATLPVEGAPIDALASGFKTEVRRRAMEQAF